jgi:hypothetical protein
MAAVTDFHSRGQPVPDQYIDLLSQEVAQEEEQGDARRAEIAPSTVSRMQRHSVERERTPVKQQALNRYELRMFLKFWDGRIKIYLKKLDQLQWLFSIECYENDYVKLVGRDWGRSGCGQFQGPIQEGLSKSIKHFS